MYVFLDCSLALLAGGMIVFIVLFFGALAGMVALQILHIFSITYLSTLVTFVVVSGILFYISGCHQRRMKEFSSLKDEIEKQQGFFKNMIDNSCNDARVVPS
jgi:membrane protein implicated in regulation of membrane protease activity